MIKMIFATKKSILIVAIQLFFIIFNKVGSSPLLGNNSKAAWDAIKNKYNEISDKTTSFVQDKFNDMSNKTSSFLKDKYNKVSKGISEFLKKFNCFGISKIFQKVIDEFGVTKARDVKFYFASQRKPNYATVTILNDTFSLNNVDFDPYRDTVLISHGFMSSGREKWLLNMKNALLQWDDVNVIVVDWQEGSNTWNYAIAAVSTQIVGDEIAKLFAHIRNQMAKKSYERESFGKIHFVGHSLGAHIVARAANVIKKDQRDEKVAWIVNRITGLDPAQPCFILSDDNKKLDENDAEFVDIIHTNARSLLQFGLGLPEQMGITNFHPINISDFDNIVQSILGFIDFYPNGGSIQPGCKEIETDFWSFIAIPSEVKHATICSHGRSHQFLIDSIIEAIPRNCSFISHPWDGEYTNTDNLLLKSCEGGDCPEMGINSINYYPRKRGMYFTPTGHQKPYCVVKDDDKQLIKDQLAADSSLWNSIKSYVSK